MKGGAHSLLVDEDADKFHYAMLSADGIITQELTILAKSLSFCMSQSGDDSVIARQHSRKAVPVALGQTLGTVFTRGIGSKGVMIERIID